MPGGMLDGVPLPELALRFVISNPDVDTVLMGARAPEEVEQNVAAVERGPLPAELLQRLDEERRATEAKVDATWVKERICSGMSSGEGLIWEVRDPVYKEERQKESTGEVHFETIQVAQGIADKRLMVQEAEFASALKQGDRSGNILSAVIRQAWESGNIKCMSNLM